MTRLTAHSLSKKGKAKKSLACPRLPRRFSKTARNDGQGTRQTPTKCHFERSEKSTQMDSSPTAQYDTAHGAPLFKSRAFQKRQSQKQKRQRQKHAQKGEQKKQSHKRQAPKKSNQTSKKRNLHTQKKDKL